MAGARHVITAGAIHTGAVARTVQPVATRRTPLFTQRPDPTRPTYARPSNRVALTQIGALALVLAADAVMTSVTACTKRRQTVMQLQPGPFSATTATTTADITTWLGGFTVKSWTYD